MSQDTLKTVGIKELKNHLSAYIREVRSGCRVLVSDRNTIVAELNLPYTQGLRMKDMPAPLGKLIDDKSIILPLREKGELALSPVSPANAFSATELLNKEREE